jgi:germination protein M
MFCGWKKGEFGMRTNRNNNEKKNNKFLIIMLCCLLVFSAIGLAGCGGDTGKGTEDDAQEVAVTLYYANADYVSSGDESLEKLMPYETTVTVDASEQGYLASLEALKEVPGEEYDTTITKDISFKEVSVEGDTAYVDLDSSGLNGGSLSETFFISQIVDTLTKSFDEIKQVQFLVNGETVESLMGHLDAAQPFTKDLFTE